MPLDNAQFISELSITDPPGTDPLSEGDDQIRTIKRATQQSFPNVNAQVTLTAAEFNGLADAALKGAANIFTAANTFNNITTFGLAIEALNNINMSNAFNLTGRNFTDTANIPIVQVNASDIISFGAGGFPAEFTGSLNVLGALIAVTYGGIAEGDLLDKSATETISGAYSFGQNIEALANINLNNAFFLQGRNAADTAEVPIVKVNATDQLEFGSGGFPALFTGALNAQGLFTAQGNANVTGILTAASVQGPTDLILRSDGGLEEAIICRSNAGQDLHFNGNLVAQTIAAISGGLQADNQATGTGLERVLTTSDIAATVFGGNVDSTGSANALPPGWSSSRTSLGLYVVTHNLGLAAAVDLAVTAIIQNNFQNGSDIQVSPIGVNSFTVNVRNVNNAFDSDFMFTAVDVSTIP